MSSLKLLTQTDYLHNHSLIPLMIRSLLKSIPPILVPLIETLIISLSHLPPWLCLIFIFLLHSHCYWLSSFICVLHRVCRVSFIISLPFSLLSFLVFDCLIDLSFYRSGFYIPLGFRIWSHQVLVFLGCLHLKTVSCWSS